MYYYGYVLYHTTEKRPKTSEDAIFINANGTWLAYLIDRNSSRIPTTVGRLLSFPGVSVRGYVCGPSSAHQEQIRPLLENIKLNDFFFVQKMLGDSLTDSTTRGVIMARDTEKNLQHQTTKQIMEGTDNSEWSKEQVYAVGYIDFYNQHIYGLAEYNNYNFRWQLYDSHNKFAQIIEDTARGVAFSHLLEQDQHTFATRIQFTNKFLDQSKVKSLFQIKNEDSY
jgi:hypothetical protein